MNAFQWNSATKIATNRSWPAPGAPWSAQVDGIADS
jgi:hypothetical protein